MRFVVLTSGGRYAQHVVVRLALAGLVPNAIVRSAPPARALPARRRAARFARGVARGALVRLSGAPAPGEARPDEWWRGFTPRLHPPAPLNGPVMVAQIREAEPDLLLLAGSGIVGEEILALPRIGTLNVHPALLPWAPGVGAVERSIERGGAVGVTAHLVDSGIDSGPIVRRELIPVDRGDNLLPLRAKTEYRSAALRPELPAAAARGEPLDGSPQSERHPMCTYPSAEE